MGLLDALLSRLRRLFGSRVPPEAQEPERSYRCAVCGTEVEGPESTCPLCGGSDVESEGERRQSGSGLQGVGPMERSVSDETTEAASVLAETDPLAAHEDRWERIDGGYRVQLADGDRKVDSKDEVRVLLYREARDRD